MRSGILNLILQSNKVLLIDLNFCLLREWKYVCYKAISRVEHMGTGLALRAVRNVEEKRSVCKKPLLTIVGPQVQQWRTDSDVTVSIWCRVVELECEGQWYEYSVCIECSDICSGSEVVISNKLLSYFYLVLNAKSIYN